MQLVPLSPTDRSADAVRSSDTLGAARRLAPSPAVPRAALASAVPAADALWTARGGLEGWNPRLNQQVATAQQSQAYLDELTAQLQGLKENLGLQLAGGTLPAERLAARRDRLEALWQGRAAQSGGGLDDQLGFSGDGQARQQFRVRGLDARALSGAGRETLAFGLGPAQRPGQGVPVVQVDPGLSARAQASRFDRALAPAGIRVQADAEGELAFSVEQAQWQRVRDLLTVRGGGQRFPAGVATRAATYTDEPALAPAQWQLDDREGQRQALAKVVQAGRQVERAREQVDGALADVGADLDRQRPLAGQGPGTARAAAAGALAQDFAARTRDGRYATLSALANGLQGLARHRIDSLLALPADPSAL